MRKIVLSIAILIMPLMTYCQTGWAKVGSKWWYSNFESWAGGTKEGYILLQSVKDTTVNDTIVNLISVTKYASGGEAKMDTSYFTKEYAGRYYFRKKADNGWYLLYDSAWASGQKYLIKFRRGFMLSKDTLMEIEISGTGFDTLNSKIISWTKFKTTDTRNYANNNFKFYKEIGYNSFFEPILQRNDIADYSVPGPLRCFSSDFSEYKLLEIGCDSLINENGKPNSTYSESATHHSIEIYPNPVQDFFKISSFEKIHSISIINVLGEKTDIPVLTADYEQTINVKQFKSSFYLILINNKCSKKKINETKKYFNNHLYSFNL